MSREGRRQVGGPAGSDEPTIELPAVVIPQTHRRRVATATRWVDVGERVVVTLGRVAERLLVRSMLALVAVALAGAGVGAVHWDDLGDFASRARRGIESLVDRGIETATDDPGGGSERHVAEVAEEPSETAPQVPSGQRTERVPAVAQPVPEPSPALPADLSEGSGGVEVVSASRALTRENIARLEVGMTLDEVVDTIGSPGIDGGAYPIRPTNPAVQHAIDSSPTWEGWDQMVWPTDIYGVGLTVIFHDGVAVDISSSVL